MKEKESAKDDATDKCGSSEFEIMWSMVLKSKNLNLMKCCYDLCTYIIKPQLKIRSHHEKTTDNNHKSN